MRSWTTFIVFGGILLALIVFWSISQYSTSKNPAMSTAQQFLLAVKKNDAAMAEKYLDPSMATVTKVGNSITKISFTDTSSIMSAAFAKQGPTSWDYLALTDLSIDLNQKPMVLNEDGLARAPLKFGRNIYLHRVGDAWKVCYIMRGAEEK